MVQAGLAVQTDVGKLAEEGYFVGPTVFADVPENAVIAQEEIFGPVLSVIKAKDLDDAIRIANGVKYALTGGIFSRSPENIAKVKRRFRVGNLYVNRKCTGALVDRQPFGGFKTYGIAARKLAGRITYYNSFCCGRLLRTPYGGFAWRRVISTASRPPVGNGLASRTSGSAGKDANQRFRKGSRRQVGNQ